MNASKLKYEAICTVYLMLIVSAMSEEWTCGNCDVITSEKNMICCDECDKWFHW